jgi:HlyD family secretion protein
MKKAIVTLILLAAVGGGAYAYYRYRSQPTPPTVLTAVVTRGDIIDAVGATGTLQAVTTVQVGTQVSGTIQELHADFNSLVRKGQVVARLDPSLFQTQIEQARANLIRAQADLERLEVGLDDGRTKLTRARELWQRQLIPQSEIEGAEVAVRSAEAQLRSAQAQVTQAEASLHQNDVNLAHTIIRSPIDGLVVSRNVDVGQTVAASMQAPTLFVLAADLSAMQVIANLDESDVGRIRPGQRVTFRVDAYPADDFAGTVSQVRLQPQVLQNVVTYATVIDVPNPALKLKPGMTANVSIEIARVANVLRVPNTALRFRPTSEIFAALGQTPPDEPAIAERRSAAVPAPLPTAPIDARTQAQAPTDSTAAAQTTRGDQAAAGAGTGRGRAVERLANLPPEQRERILQRLAARGVNPSQNGADIGPASARRAPPARTADAAPAPSDRPGGTIDALFGPLPVVESVGRVWVQVDGQFVPIRVRLGITDGQMTELIESDLKEGDALVSAVNTGAATTRTTTPSGAGGFLFVQPAGRGGGQPGTRR